MRLIFNAGIALTAGLALLASPAAAAPKAPDLTVAKLQASGSAAPGQAIAVTVTVKNAGRGRAKGSQIAFALSRDAKSSTDDRALAPGAAKALAAKKSAASTAQLIVPAGTAPGAYRLIACADARRKVRESDEKNNCRASGAVQVLAGVFGKPGATTPAGPIAPGTATTPPATPTPVATPTATATATATPTPTATATATPTPTATPDFPEPPLTPAADPADVAPGTPSTRPTSVAEGTEFLYTGANPIQKEVAGDAISAKQVAVIRGKVLTAAGQPMKGARITVLDHPELGYTATREDGGYDLAVNGGADLTLHFEQQGYMSVQRTEPIPWQDYVDLQDVVMTPYDDKITKIDENAATLQVATGETTPADDAAPRQATLMFEPGTDATMKLPNGQTKPLGDLEVRATEYTAGAGGDEAMPGQLPDTSAYTYAVEFSVDEAVRAGATDVTFTKPVVTYVDNFLGFKAGTIVPSAYYDEAKGAWVPASNGVVIKLLSKTGDLDVDGDGIADTGAKLTALGIDDAERGKLAKQYDAGKSLWRVEVKHFTPWDYNWPYGCKADCDAPDNDPPPPPYCPECEAAGSIIGVYNQTLGEKLKITGTPFALHYSSARVPGYKDAYRLKIPLTGNSIRPTLRRVELEVTVAGRELRQTFTAAKNLTYDFQWDGKDAYGRALEGAQNAHVRIGYAYPAEYLEPGEFAQSFGQFGGAPVTRSEGGATEESRREIIAWQEWDRPVGTLGAGSDALGGWTLDIHHAYDPQARTLYLGDGTKVTTEAIRSEIRTVAGVDPYHRWDSGTPATRFPLSVPRGTDVAADGSVYVAETGAGRIVRVTAEGQVEYVAGLGTGGDGGLALQAGLLAPRDVAVAGDGSVYISDSGSGRIRRIAPNGTISTVAGGGDPDSLGDGGLATDASLKQPRGLAVAADGTLYVAETGRDRVRRISTDGRIATVAGGGASLNDGGRAADATLDLPTDVAVAADGTLYIADAQHGRVRRVTPSGDIDTLAGTGGTGSSGDGGAATAAEIGQPYGVDAAPDGTVYFADRLHHVVRRIGKDGTINAFAGTGHSGGEGDGGAPQQAALSFPEDVTVAPDGSVAVADTGNGRIRRAAPGLPGFIDADFSLPSEDGTEVYMFDRDGRHLRTVDALTGALRWRFDYDAAGRVTGVTDGDGNATAIERDAAGKATAVVAPGNVRTALTLRGDGFLGTVKNPENEAVTLDYAAGGLLKTLTDPLGKAAHFGYDATTGRLTSDEDKGGSTVALAREATATGYRIRRTSELGKDTVFEAQTLPTGDMRSTTTDPSGAKTVMDYGADGVTRITAADGSVTTTKLGPDPRWGMRAPIPVETTQATPGGRRKVVDHERSVSLARPADPFSIDTLVDRFTVNGRTSVREYDGATRTLQTTSGEGRKLTTTFDAKGRPLTQGYGPGVAPRSYTWDARGRLAKVVQGGRELTYAFDAAKPQRLVSQTDGDEHTTTFGYDEAGRITSVKLPGGGTYGFTYDDAGNRTGITMPNGKTHAYGYSATGQATSYAPPGVAAQTRAFDADHVLASSTLPGRGTTAFARKADGRLTGAGASAFAYGDATDRIADATRGAVTTHYAYDGPLVTGKDGATFTYDDDLRLSSIDGTKLSYDADGLVTGYGPFTLTRTGPVGAPTKVADAALDLALAYDDGGRQSGRSLTVAGAKRYDVAVTRDDAGRIAKRVETIAGATRTYDYAYWPDGQLRSVKDGATVLESYAYDANGNRTGAAYTDDDRMTSRGATAYDYDAAGFLASRGADTFGYGDSGELLQATVGGKTVTYAYDSAGRRVARTEGGVRTDYVYGDPARPYLVTASRAGGVLTTYYYSTDDLLFALQRGATRYYVGADQVGTPRVVTDASGAVVKTLAYDSFGRRDRAAETGAAFELPIGFAGGLEDPVTGLVRFGLRDYEPESGRWTARDPILHAGGMNLYAYAGSDPVAKRDPSGLDEGGGGGGFMGFVQSVHDFFTSDNAGTAIEVVSSIDSDSPIVQGAGQLKDGMGKLETIQEVAETALEVKEALDEPTDPEQAAGLLKCGLKLLKKVLPLDLIGLDAAGAVLDKGMEHARDQRDFGSINSGVQRQLAEIGMN